MKSTRTINEAQIGLYRLEWNKARRVLRQTLPPDEADARRHAIHVDALGEDKSSVDFTNDDLDEVLKRFKAISKPAGFNDQIELADQPAKRARFKVAELLAAVGKSEAHVDRLIQDRRAAGRLLTVRGDAAAGTDTLGPADLERLALDLKAECVKRWPRKGDLLNELRLMRMEFEFDEATARAAVGAALKVCTVPEYHTLSYDMLLRVIATLRRIMNGALRPACAAGDPDWTV